METAKVSAKGWIVIPAALRRKYHIEPGDAIEVVDYGGVLSLVPAEGNPVRDGRGALRGKKGLGPALLKERARERRRDRKR